MRIYVIYDSRAVSNIDAASVMSVCAPPETRSDAIREAPQHGACVIYSYERDAAGATTDERHEWSDPRLGEREPS